MKLSRMSRALVLLCLAACASAQELDPPKDLEASPKKAALEAMLAERGTPAEFEKAIAAAKKQGVGKEPVLEARFLYWVDRHDDDKLIALLPDFMEQKEHFDVADSEIFSLKEDWEAVVEYLQALQALKKGDKDGFKKHITEAFWLSPRQGEAFASHIERLRQDEAMAAVKLEASSSFEEMNGARKKTFGELTKDRKALLVLYWTPFSEECQESMPDFKAVAEELGKNDIAVAAALAATSDEILKEAKTLVGASFKDKPPGVWLKGEAAAELGRKLHIQSMPAMILISPAGTVIYSGEPSDDKLWEELKKISPSIKRPSMPEE